MAVTPTDFKARYTEFATLSDARIQIFLDDAVLELDVVRWGDLYDRGLAALAAHFLAISERTSLAGTTGGGGAIGPLASKSVGDVSLSYGWTGNSASGSRDQNYYLSTVYGQDYLRLVAIVGYGMVAVVV
jgi:hypothetical protein